MPKLDPRKSRIFPAERVNWRVGDFCVAHGIGRTRFYQEVASGQLKIIKVGTRTLIPAAEAEAWQERKMEAAQ